MYGTVVSRNFFKGATLVAILLSVAACADKRQIVYGGAMQPVYSLPLPDSRGVVVIGYNDAPRGKVSRYRGRGRSNCRCAPRRAHKAVASAAAGEQRYWRVLNDPPYPPIIPRYQREQEAAKNDVVPPLGGVTGQWAVSGDKPGCRVNLSASWALGIMRASASGCAGQALSAVSGWRRFGRNGVELVQPGNKSAVKFVESGSNRFDSIESADKLNLQMRR